MSVSGSHDLVWVAIAAVAVACAAAGCVDPDADGGQVVETELLRISTTADRPICAGTPIWLDSELGRIGEALSLPLWGSDSKLDVHFVAPWLELIRGERQGRIEELVTDPDGAVCRGWPCISTIATPSPRPIAATATASPRAATSGR